jgi:hypothetical protein
MAVVVIVIMFGFVGGSALQQLLQRKTGMRRTIAYFADNRKITNNDLLRARQELEILRLLRADILLQSIPMRILRTQDLRPLLLSQLLFSERRTAPILIQRIRRLVGTNKYYISDKQINDIYKHPMGSDIYWLLLKNETNLAGVRISNEYAGNQLAGVVGDLFDGATYKQLIGTIVNRRRISEKEILTTFAKLLAVMQYCAMVCSNENITTSQIMHDASSETERIDVEFVRFDSSVFAESQDQPSEEKISEHFEKYKTFFAGDVNEQNPYAFGYKLPHRAQLEYIAVKIDDLADTVTKPTQEETEEYYQKHREEFTEMVPSDPNDANSPPIQRTKSYAEVAEIISDLLRQKKIYSKANTLLQKAKTLTEPALEDTEPQDLTIEQLKNRAGDYKAAADQLTKEYKTKIYVGKTGLLSARDIQQDEYLARLYADGYGHNPPQFLNRVQLARIIFSIDDLGTSQLGLFDTAKPRLYDNIGPLKDTLGQIVAVVRVTEAEKPSVPESINHTYDKSTLKFEHDPNRTEESSQVQDVYSVREKVVEDLKKLAAMDLTKTKTTEFIKQVVRGGWEDAIDKFNKLYGPQDKKDDADPNAFTLEKLTGLMRISKKAIGFWTVQSRSSPTGQLLVDEIEKEAQLMDKIYSLVPQDSNSLDTVPHIVEFKPNMGYYCLKSLSVNRLSRDDFEKIKLLQAYKEDLMQSQNLAAVHFNPENILKRMNFRPVEEEKPADVNVPTEPGETS